MEMNRYSETDSKGGLAGPLRRQQCIELAVFLFLIVPSMAFSFLMIRQAGPLGFALLSVAVIFRDLGLMGLVLFLVWRNGEPFSALGFSLKNLGGEMGLGFLLFFPMTFAAATLENSLQNAGLSATSVPMPALVSEKGLPEFVLAFFLVAVVALAEETIFRDISSCVSGRSLRAPPQRSFFRLRFFLSGMAMREWRAWPQSVFWG